MNLSPSIPVRRACLLAFVTAFVILAMQVLVSRLVSAKLLNNYAFFVISLTMLGFAFSGVILSRWLPGFVARLPETINVCSAFFVISTLVVSGLFCHVGLGTQKFADRNEFVVSF